MMHIRLLLLRCGVHLLQLLAEVGGCLLLLLCCWCHLSLLLATLGGCLSLLTTPAPLAGVTGITGTSLHTISCSCCL
jgi:hypothetical protein